jgi:hypothetical protein
MPKLRQVDASQVCDELQALCDAAELFLRGSFPQGHESAKTHARCLYQLLGDSPDNIVAKSGNSLTTTYICELSHYVPWQIEFMAGAENCHPSWQVLTAGDIAFLRRWLELIQNAESALLTAEFDARDPWQGWKSSKQYAADLEIHTKSIQRALPGLIKKKQADRKSERGKINLRKSACEILKPQS